MAERRFEVFTGRFRAGSNSIRVSLNKRGDFLLNRKAYIALGNPTFVQLLYEHQTGAIGLKGISGATKFSYPVRRNGNSKSSYQITAQAFCDNYGIARGELVVFSSAVMEDGILVIERENPNSSSSSQQSRSVVNE
jgi:hypothetical protein